MSFTSLAARIEWTPNHPDTTGWKVGHLRAVRRYMSSAPGNTIETGTRLIVRAGRCYAHAHRRQFDSSIRDDCVLGDHHAAIEREVRELRGHYLMPTVEHMVASHEAALVLYFQGWLVLGDALTDLSVEDPDQVERVGRSWALLGSELRGLLNGPSGALDCGTLDSLLCRTAQRVADFFGEGSPITRRLREEELI